MQNGKLNLLRWALGANAGFSGLSGLVLLLAAGPVGEWLGVTEPWILRGIGGGLVAYAVWLAALTREETPRRSLVVTASLADFAWVAGSVLLLVAGPQLLTPPGRWAVAIVAVVVADFGVVQLLGLWREARPSRTGDGSSCPV